MGHHRSVGIGVALVTVGVLCMVLSPSSLSKPEPSMATRFAGELSRQLKAQDVVHSSTDGEGAHHDPLPHMTDSVNVGAPEAVAPVVAPAAPAAVEVVEVEEQEQPAAHCDYSDICKLEAAHKYEAAFEAYEAREEECGRQGWEVIKVLGEGMSGKATLQKTPCGLVHAAKQPPKGGNAIGSEKMLRAHIQVDCFVLKHLTPLTDKCDGCFPRYFYHSQKSGICYNEFVDSVPLTKFVTSLNMTSPEGVTAMKMLFHQAVDALTLLKGEDMVHRDLQAQNMLVRVTPENKKRPLQLVIMDFCWIDWDGVPVKKFSVEGRKLGRFTRTPDFKEHGEEDTYAFACAVADIVFMSGKTFKDKDKYRKFCLPEMETARTDKTSLEYVIWRMTQQEHANREHDFKTMHSMVDQVTKVSEGLRITIKPKPLQ